MYRTPNSQGSTSNWHTRATDERVGAINGLASLALLMLAVGLCGKAFRVFRRETAVFHPRRGPVARTDLGAGFAGLEVTFTSCDGTRLSGWLLPSRNAAAVILAHGSEADRTQLLPEAKLLHALGYGVLLFDWPGHGESGGRVQWGDTERRALEAAIDFVACQPSIQASRIGVLGFSMGGAIVAQVAGRDSRLRAIVLEATFADAIEQTRYFSGRWWGILMQWPSRFADWWQGMDLRAMRPIERVAGASPRSVLIIGGTKDTVVPAWMVRRLYDAAREPKELWIVPDAGHGGYDRLLGGEYGNRISSFFDNALGMHSVSD